ncbi:MAG: hypothetical protein L3K17_01110 [Thermoplasmata archaeon]|nr:hypothetical protein [Thermoplasmata archaeon]
MAVRRSAPVAEAELLAEYPFLPGAESLLAGLTPSLRDLLTDPTYERARLLGRARVRAAADDPTGGTVVEELARAVPAERFLSFYYARLLLSAAPSPAALRRWAVAEAKQSYGRWRTEPLPTLIDISDRLHYPLTEAEGASVALTVPDYLRLATAIREADFRLARQDVADGKVSIARDRAARLLQEAVRLALTAPVPLTDDVVGLLREREAEFLADLAQRVPLPTRPAPGGPASYRPELFPPCIRKMVRMLQAGENLSHAGRFALAAFLHRTGATFETIVDAYRGAPDFDESITRYQVEHITQRGGGEGYTPPECDTLRTHGLCFRDGDPTAPNALDRSRDDRCFEPTLRHPLTYYRRRGGKVRAVPEESVSAAHAPSRPGPPP